MKKFMAILLALVIGLSTSLVVFAVDVYTCPTCGKKYVEINDYNACIEDHNSAGSDDPEKPAIYECPTCFKKFTDIDDYNACVDSHFDNVNYHYDKYVGMSVIDVISSFVDIFNNTGIMDIFMNIFEKLSSYIGSIINPA